MKTNHEIKVDLDRVAKPDKDNDESNQSPKNLKEI